MKIKAPENENYAAVVTTIKSIVTLDNCDNVVGTPLFGFQAIVGNDTKVGDVGIVFPAETQLSEEFCKENNLFRHAELNQNKDKAGYIEDNRRVKAMKFRGHRSDSLFMPLTSLSYIKKLKLDDLKDGDSFDQLYDHEICKKYVIKRPVSRIQKNKFKFVRVDKMYLPEHFDSDQYFRNSESIPDDAAIIVTQKLHGTSIRIANTIVARRLNLLEKSLKKLGVKVQTHEFAHVGGSKKVVKDPDNPAQNHFYDIDIWTTEAMKLKGMVPENYILYGELIGWVGETPIQKNYTYQVPVGTCDLYIYRIAIVNGQGRIHDMTWGQLKEFCTDMGLKYVPELWVGLHKDFKVDDFTDRRFADEGYAGAVPLAKESPVDEGVCIRVDGLVPYILKAKGEEFYAHESKMLDEEAIDLESQGSETIN